MPSLFYGWRRKASYVTLVVAAILTMSWIGNFILETQRENRFRQRGNALREVCDWLTRGEGSLPFPESSHFDEEGEPTAGWRAEVVAECLPTGTHFRPYTKWDSPDYAQIEKRGEGWVTRLGESGPLMMAIIGTGTAFEKGQPITVRSIPSDTILFVEVIRPDLKWLQPIDIEISTLLNAPDDHLPHWIRSDLGDGFHLAFADRTIWFVSRSTPASLLARFADISKSNSRDRVAEFARFRKR